MPWNDEETTPLNPWHVKRNLFCIRRKQTSTGILDRIQISSRKHTYVWIGQRSQEEIQIYDPWTSLETHEDSFYLAKSCMPNRTRSGLRTRLKGEDAIQVKEEPFMASFLAQGWRQMLVTPVWVFLQNDHVQEALDATHIMMRDSISSLPWVCYRSVVILNWSPEASPFMGSLSKLPLDPKNGNGIECSNDDAQGDSQRSRA